MEEDLEKHFSQYGTIEEIKILKRENGAKIGCAFIQFEHVQSAAKAIHYANLKPLLDRPIIVDWAIPKNKFSKNNSENINQEDEIKVKVEVESDIEDNINNIKKLNSNEELNG